MILLLIVILISLIFIINYLIVNKLSKQKGELSNNLVITSPNELAYLFHDFENSIKVALLELEFSKYITLSKNRQYFRLSRKEFESKRFSPFVQTLYYTLKNGVDNHYNIKTICEEMAAEKDVLRENAKLHNKLAENGLTQTFERFDMFFFSQFISISIISMFCILGPITTGSHWLIFLGSMVLGATSIFFLTKLTLSHLTEEGKEYIHMKAKTITPSFQGDPNLHALLLNTAKLGKDGFKELGLNYYNA